MWQMLRKRLGARDGFTLIELVVVVAILGLLAVIVTPKVLGAIDNAKESGNMTGAKQIQVGLERIYAEKGGYPTYATLCGTGTAPACAPATLATALKDYVNLDDANLTAASYVPDNTNKTYTLTLTFKNNAKLYTVKPESVTPPTP
ncbi:MAG TPA: prepilin-type N-terminal cleavage/methylation domain-containing protein [Symbiobacteriaceae bacterium]|nr:prepilin-type N-terminal cleavage/methylation domain-containing protein [Symbiobacteriaceae bacterium]